MTPPLVRRKLIPFAQSRELPPPRPMIESTSRGAAKARPVSTIALSGFAPNCVEQRRVDRFGAEQAHRLIDEPGITDPAVGDQQWPAQAELRGQARRVALNVPSPNTTRVRGRQSNETIRSKLYHRVSRKNSHADRAPETVADPVADLRHRRDRVRVRHLRNPDAAADRAAGAAGADRRGAGIARVPDVGRDGSSTSRRSPAASSACSAATSPIASAAGAC